MRLFGSATKVDQPPASELIAALRAAGHEVDHSSRDLDDPRWADWIHAAARQAIQPCETIVFVQDWNDAPWTEHERLLAGERDNGRDRHWRTVYDPQCLHALTGDLPQYDGLRLPCDLAQAVALATCHACAPFGRDLATSEPAVRFTLGGWGFDLTIDSHPSLDVQGHEHAKQESEFWLLRCRNCQTWWHVGYVPWCDRWTIEPANITSVEEWRKRLAPHIPAFRLPRGHNAMYLWGAAGFVTAIVLKLWLNSR